MCPPLATEEVEGITLAERATDTNAEIRRNMRGEAVDVGHCHIPDIAGHLACEALQDEPGVDSSNL